MTFEQWQKAILPKVQGTWNLHEATLKEPLDFFFLFGSVSGVSGQWGQANYASGNTFLDAFVQYRHSLGLPCSTVNIGAIGEIGYLSQNPEKLEAIRVTGMHIVQERELLDSIELMLQRSYPQSTPMSTYVNHSQIGLGVRSTVPLSAPNNRLLWRKDPRFALYRNLEIAEGPSDGTSSIEDIRKFLRDASSSISFLKSFESAQFLASAIGKTLFGFMMLTDDGMDLNLPMATLGIDSLITIELRNWIRQRIGVEITVVEIMGAPSISQLGELVQEKLVEKLGVR
jgi:acyl carrier protein